MAEAEAIQAFKEGLSLFRNHHASKALPHFVKAVELDRANPFYLSYLGLALAAAERKWEQAETACQSAVSMRRTQPELYLNLSEIYRLQGKRADALETLTTGLTLTRQDARLSQALRKMGVRHPPVLNFLDRSHFLNVELGKLRYRILKSMGKEV